MDMEKIFKNDKKDVVITIRISEEDKIFIERSNLSPSGFFRECLKDLKECTYLNKKAKLKRIWEESRNNVKKQFTICKGCNRIYLARTEDLKNKIRLCDACRF